MASWAYNVQPVVKIRTADTTGYVIETIKHTTMGPGGCVRVTTREICQLSATELSKGEIIAQVQQQTTPQSSSVPGSSNVGQTWAETSDQNQGLFTGFVFSTSPSVINTSESFKSGEDLRKDEKTPKKCKVTLLQDAACNTACDTGSLDHVNNKFETKDLQMDTSEKMDLNNCEDNSALKCITLFPSEENSSKSERKKLPDNINSRKIANDGKRICKLCSSHSGKQCKSNHTDKDNKKNPILLCVTSHENNQPNRHVSSQIDDSMKNCHKKVCNQSVPSEDKSLEKITPENSANNQTDTEKKKGPVFICVASHENIQSNRHVFSPIHNSTKNCRKKVCSQSIQREDKNFDKSTPKNRASYVILNPNRKRCSGSTFVIPDSKEECEKENKTLFQNPSLIESEDADPYNGPETVSSVESGKQINTKCSFCSMLLRCSKKTKEPAASDSRSKANFISCSNSCLKNDKETNGSEISKRKCHGCSKKRCNKIEYSRGFLPENSKHSCVCKTMKTKNSKSALEDDCQECKKEDSEYVCIDLSNSAVNTSKMFINKKNELSEENSKRNRCSKNFTSIDQPVNNFTSKTSTVTCSGCRYLRNKNDDCCSDSNSVNSNSDLCKNNSGHIENEASSKSELHTSSFNCKSSDSNSTSRISSESPEFYLIIDKSPKMKGPCKLEALKVRPSKSCLKNIDLLKTHIKEPTKKVSNTVHESKHCKNKNLHKICDSDSNKKQFEAFDYKADSNKKNQVCGQSTLTETPKQGNEADNLASGHKGIISPTTKSATSEFCRVCRAPLDPKYSCKDCETTMHIDVKNMNYQWCQTESPELKDVCIQSVQEKPAKGRVTLDTEIDYIVEGNPRDINEDNEENLSIKRSLKDFIVRWLWGEPQVRESSTQVDKKYIKPECDSSCCKKLYANQPCKPVSILVCKEKPPFKTYGNDVSEGVEETYPTGIDAKIKKPMKSDASTQYPYKHVDRNGRVVVLEYPKIIEEFSDPENSNDSLLSFTSIDARDFYKKKNANKIFEDSLSNDLEDDGSYSDESVSSPPSLTLENNNETENAPSTSSKYKEDKKVHDSNTRETENEINRQSVIKKKDYHSRSKPHEKHEDFFVENSVYYNNVDKPTATNESSDQPDEMPDSESNKNINSKKFKIDK